MKVLRKVILALIGALFITSFYNCGGGDDPAPPTPSQKEIETAYLVDKSGGWSLKSVTVPSATATTEDQWGNFKVTVSSSTMSTSGHPSGSNAVWPTGGWTMNESGNTITRADGVVMTVRTLTATSFMVSFTVPDGTEISGRIAALDGDYVFDLE